MTIRQSLATIACAGAIHAGMGKKTLVCLRMHHGSPDPLSTTNGRVGGLHR